MDTTILLNGWIVAVIMWMFKIQGIISAKSPYLHRCNMAAT